MKFGICLFRMLIVAVLIFALPAAQLTGSASPLNQNDAAAQKAQQMLARMTPEERVGQLFLVTHTGTTIDENSAVYSLITKYHVGGVILLRSNDNFTGAGGVLTQTRQLSAQFQQAEWDGAQDTVTNPNGTSYVPQYIPLLVGISQEGDGYPNDQILSGLTEMPSLMSIGATWNPELARKSGEVLGGELAALGINLYFGPSLDVLDTPQMESGEDLGVRTFGGDPYWVGKMGQAFVSGLHEGSENRLMVIAKHFPGRGSSDRSPEEEIATVRKSLEQLKQIELAPFFAVTGSTTPPEAIIDGLLVSHIRYQGFQGNIRATTRPVSSDSAALNLILEQPPLSQWRQSGGVMISDNLGSQAVRRFYDPTGNAFDARMAAREAFFAGNDLLYLDHFVSSGDPDAYTTIIRTIDFFAQKYREDGAFAQRVDASVGRVLTMKYRLYQNFALDGVIPSGEGLDGLGQSQQVAEEIARRSVTLISPDMTELLSAFPSSPEVRDRIIFLTDVQPGRQCSGCSEYVSLGVDALQSAVLRLYGPRAGGLVSPNLMTSYSFTDLWKYLNGSTDLELLEDDLQLADWVVVSMLKPTADQVDTQAFRRLLSERPEMLRNKKVIVFAFNAPYYLDATDISKLTAYYGLYSKTEAFVEVAAKILFQEQVTTGSLPVSVPGIGYDLIHATSPDPTQVIPLFIEVPEEEGQAPAATQAPTPAPILGVGDTISLRTGLILDYNHNPVPDGTPVRFRFNMISQEGPSQLQVDTVTMDGVARANYSIERSGVLDIQASTEQGGQSNLLRLDLLTGGVTQVPPTPQPTQTPQPTPTITPSPTVTITPTEIPAVEMPVSNWLAVVVIIAAAAAGISWLGIRQMVARWGLRWALCGVIGGLVAYNYMALGFPGSEELIRDGGPPAVLAITIIGVLTGWAAGMLWKQLSAPAGRPSDRASTGPKSQSGSGG